MEKENIKEEAKEETVLKTRVNIMKDLIETYQATEGGNDELLSEILKGFETHINYNIRKIYGRNNEDIKTNLIYEIHKWLKKDNLTNPYGYIYSNIRYYIKNYINRNLFYPELTNWEIQTFVKLKNQYRNKDIALNAKDCLKMKKIQDKIIKKAPYDEILKCENKENTPYIFKDVLNCLNEYETILINSYYINKFTYEKIGILVGKNRRTIKENIDKIIDKLSVEMENTYKGCD